MNGRGRLRAVLAFWILGSGLSESAEPKFALSIAAPTSVTGEAGSPRRYGAVVKLTTTGLEGRPRGAQAWSLSLSSEPGKIVSATTAGTIVDVLFEDGFQHTELTGGKDNEGAVSAVVLSLRSPLGLPLLGTVDLLRVEVEVIPPRPVSLGGSSECEPLYNRIFFVDGLRGSGQPVDNRITFEGLSFVPIFSEAVTSVCPAIARPVNLEVAVLSPRTQREESDDEALRFLVPVPLGALEQLVTAGIVMRSDLPGLPEPDRRFPKNLGGVQGWSISVATEPCFGLFSATVEGTAAAEEPVGYSRAGFEKTEVVHPARNLGQQGAVSAVVLSFMQGNTLPPKGAEVILKLLGRMPSAISDPGEVSPGCLVRIVRPWENGLVGSGQPVQTGVTVFGRTVRPGARDGVLALVGAEEKLFVRGNANGDDKVNIADPIWIVNELYRLGPASACADASDANDDGFVDSSDAVYLILWLFRSGPPPSAPFPSCGTDRENTADGLGCAETQAVCRAR